MQDSSPLLSTYQYDSLDNFNKSDQIVEFEEKSTFTNITRRLLLVTSVMAFSMCVFTAGWLKIGKVSSETDLSAFAIRQPGDPLSPGDELLGLLPGNVGAERASETSFRMVYDDGTVKLYAKARAVTALQKSNWDNLLWTAAKNLGGWGEPYWDLYNYEASQGRVLPKDEIAAHNAILTYTKRVPERANKYLIKFVDPEDDSIIYYDVEVGANLACDSAKLVLGPDGNLMLLPYSSTSTVTCDVQYKSGPYTDYESISPTARPTKRPTRQPLSKPPTKAPVTAKPSKQPVTAKPTKKPVTARPTRISAASSVSSSRGFEGDVLSSQRQETELEQRGDSENSQETELEQRGDSENSQESELEQRGDSENSQESELEQRGDSENSQETSAPEEGEDGR